MILSDAVGLSLAITRTFIPYGTAAVGASVSEQAGLVNITMEGFLLISALGTALGAGHGAGAAALCGLLAALALAIIYGVLTVLLEADAVLCGVAVNLLADGLSRFVLKLVYDSTGSSPRLPALQLDATLPALLALVLAIVALTFALRRTVFGLRLRALGENSAAVLLAGGSVLRGRFQAVLLTGLLTALGGIFLIFEQRQFVAGMTGGRGYIGIAAMIIGRAAPPLAAAAALAFAAVEALALRQQVLQIAHLPNWLVQLVPYVFALLLLCLRGSRGAVLVR